MSRRSPLYTNFTKFENPMTTATDYRLDDVHAQYHVTCD